MCLAFIAGLLISIHYKLAIILIALISMAIILLNLRNTGIYLFFFITLIWIPIWINSFSLLGLRFGIVVINIPLIFSLIFIIKALQDMHNKTSILEITFVDIMIFFYLLWVVTSFAIKSKHPQSISQLYQLVFPLLYYFTIKSSLIKKEYLISWMKILTYASVMASLYLIFEFITQVNIFLPPEDYVNKFIYGYTEKLRGVYQASGPFMDPNIAGLFISFVISMSLYFFNIARGKKERIKWLIMTCILSLGIISTLSRTSFICLISVVLIHSLYAVKKKSKIVITAITIVLISTIILLIVELPSPLAKRINDISSIKARVVYFQDFFKLIKDNWVTGLGFDNFRYRWQWNVSGPAHNIFVTTIIELGIIGLVPIITVICAISLTIKKYTKELVIDKYLLATFTGIFISYYIGGLTSNVYFYIQHNAIFFIFLSLLLNHKDLLIKSSLK